MPAPTREDTWLITLSVDNADYGIWDTFNGGEGDSEESKYSPGGMEPEISLGGRQTLGNITVGRYLDRGRDWPKIKTLYGKRGRGRCTVGVTPLQFDGSRGGDPLTYTGTLKQVTMPDVDSTGGDAAILELEITVDGTVA
jgi:hypothetical protein